MIRIEAIWLAVEPVGLRMGLDSALVLGLPWQRLGAAAAVRVV